MIFFSSLDSAFKDKYWFNYGLKIKFIEEKDVCASLSITCIPVLYFYTLMSKILLIATKIFHTVDLHYFGNDYIQIWLLGMNTTKFDCPFSYNLQQTLMHTSTPCCARLSVVCVSAVISCWGGGERDRAPHSRAEN